jgi:hypothetical protein
VTPPPAWPPTGAGHEPLPAGLPGTGHREPRRHGLRVGEPRAVLTGVRLPHLPVFDVVTFVAACPGCGHDCTWVEERDDTRVQTRIECDCEPVVGTP